MERWPLKKELKVMTDTDPGLLVPSEPVTGDSEAAAG